MDPDAFRRRRRSDTLQKRVFEEKAASCKALKLSHLSADALAVGLKSPVPAAGEPSPASRHARTDIRTHEHARTHTHTHTPHHPPTRQPTHPRTHARTCVRVHARTHVRARARTQVRRCAGAQTRRHAGTQARRHAGTQARRRIHIKFSTFRYNIGFK